MVQPDWVQNGLNELLSAQRIVQVELVDEDLPAVRAIGNSAPCIRLLAAVSGNADHYVARHGKSALLSIPVGTVLAVCPDRPIAVGLQPARMFNVLLGPGYVLFRRYRRRPGHEPQSESHLLARSAWYELSQWARLLSAAYGRASDDPYLLHLVRGLLLLADDALQRGPEAGVPGADTFAALCQVLADGLDEAWDRQRLADIVQIHPNHVSRLFRRHAGMGFVDYLARERLDRVRQLLQCGETYTIAEAARRAGFSSSAYLAQTCRRVLGCRPQDLRHRASL